MARDAGVRERAGRAGLVSNMNPGDRIGPYRLTAVLGRGGMGEVFSAIHERSQQAVAIKLLSQVAPDRAARLVQEARALAMLDHPGIVRVLFLGEQQERIPYLVLEQVAGQSLRALLRECPHGLPPERSLRLVTQVAQAVAAAHAQGIVHRDLKPDNIMVVAPADGPEHIKLIDFGIASVPAPADSQFDTWVDTADEGPRWLGTVAYMAPEQCRRSDQISPKADVYALGLVLCELFSGRPLFNAPDAVTLAALQLQAQPDLSFLPAGPLRRLTARLLAKDPSQRPAMAEVAVALGQLASPTVPRRSAISGFLAVGGAGLLVAAGLARQKSGRPPAKRGGQAEAEKSAIDVAANGVLPKWMSPSGLVLLDQLEHAALSDAELFEALPPAYRSLPFVRMHAPTTIESSEPDFEPAASRLSAWFHQTLEPLLQQHPDYRLLYFGLAPIPLVTYLGWLISPRRPVEVRLRHHRKLRFQPWVERSGPPLRMSARWSRERDEREGDIVVRISTSHLVNLVATRDAVASPLCEIDLQLESPSEDVFSAEADVIAVADTWKTTLDALIQRFPRTRRVHLFASVQAGLALLLGTRVSQSMHPPISMYQYRAGSQRFALIVNPAPRRRPAQN